MAYAEEKGNISMNDQSSNEAMIRFLERQLKDSTMRTRDAVAIQALSGMLAGSYAKFNGMSVSDYARDAYEMADAFLEVRNGG
jgi:hypothetical protein